MNLDKDKNNWLIKLVEKIPGDLAAPVFLIVIIIVYMPRILMIIDKTHHIYCILFLGVIITVGMYSIYLSAKSKYREREAESNIKLITSLDDSIREMSEEGEKQIEIAVTRMREMIKDE